MAQSAEEIVLAGEVFVYEERKEGKKTTSVRVLNPRLQRAFEGKAGLTAAQALIKKAREKTPEGEKLRAKMEEQEFDIDGFAEMIENAQTDA